MARSTRRDDRPGREREGGWVVLALVVGLAVLFGGGYVAAYAAAGDRVPVGTTVAGVDVGGHDPATAAQMLREGLAARAATPFTVIVNGHRQQVRPAQAGLAVDYAASVRKADAARSWHPSRLWDYFTDGVSFEPVVTLDQDRLGALLQRLDQSDGRTPTDGGVAFRHESFTIRKARPGLTIDPQAAGTAFWSAYLSDDPTVRLQTTPTSPAIDTAAVDRFVRRFANPAMASPVRLRFGSASVRLSPAEYGHLLVAQRVGNRLRPAVQTGGLMRLARSGLVVKPGNRPRPATVVLVGGRPHVVPARAGVRFTSRAVGHALLQAIASPGRSAAVRPTSAKAAFTTTDARHLGIRERLASYDVPVPGGGAALSAAAQHLDGIVLRPGSSLSLRGRLGGSTPDGAGGNALATAFFNAAWLGGLQVTAHATPASYAGTVSPGRDASLRNGHDLVVRDDTRSGVLVSATVRGGRLTVTLWSTKHWTVTSRHGARTHVVVAGRRVDHGPGCRSRAGRDGFQVTVTRTFARSGHADRASSYTVRYRAVPAVVCHAHHHGHHHHGHHHGHRHH